MGALELARLFDEIKTEALDLFEELTLMAQTKQERDSIEHKMQEIEHYLKQKFDETKKGNTKAAMHELQATESEAFEKISGVIESGKGYSAESMPGKDFRAYMAKLKEEENSKEVSIPTNDRYTYYKKALPDKISKIH